MKLRLIMLFLIGTLLVGVTTPAAAGRVQAASAPSVVTSHTHAHPAAFDKTRFVAHLAFAAWLVHYIYKKYKEGKLGRTHLFTTAKAVLAALLALHEMQKAYSIAKTSNSKTLQVLIKPMTALISAVNNEYSKLKHGDTSGVSSANTAENTLQTTASHTEFAYKDQQQKGYNPGF
jgi:hypothetical protein